MAGALSNDGARSNIIQEKSYSFALKIVLFCRQFNKGVDYPLVQQLIRSGTSVGANVEEAIGAYSKKDFAAKMGIAYKEARETRYRIRLLRDAGMESSEILDPILKDSEELIKILVAILRTARSDDS